MKWYKKQLQALQQNDEEKDKKSDNKPAQKGFQPFQRKDKKVNILNPVSARNRNRSKTDLP